MNDKTKELILLLYRITYYDDNQKITEKMYRHLGAYADQENEPNLRRWIKTEIRDEIKRELKNLLLDEIDKL
jgi:hypothetical protein